MAINENVLGTVVVLGLILIVGSIALGPTILRHLREKRVLESGKEAPAKVLEVIDTKKRHNYDTICLLKLEVQPEGEAPFAGEAEIPLSAADAIKYQPGTVIRVRYDPENRSTIAIVR
jgi:hypothetical protein